MHFLDLTLPTPEENLALEEALLEEAEASGSAGLLRLWESPSPFVVLGSASVLREDVVLDACRRDRVPVLRRHSGGGTVLQGPGCLNFSLVLPYTRAAELESIDGTFRYVLQAIARGLEVLGFPVQYRAVSDLCWQDRKVSGSGQRRRRHHVLLHGTVLYAMDLDLVSRYLREPRRQPAYRRDRCHEDFLANLPLKSSRLRRALMDVWRPNGSCARWPSDAVARLVAEKYTQASWIQRR